MISGANISSIRNTPLIADTRFSSPRLLATRELDFFSIPQLRVSWISSQPDQQAASTDRDLTSAAAKLST